MVIIPSNTSHGLTFMMSGFTTFTISCIPNDTPKNSSRMISTSPMELHRLVHIVRSCYNACRCFVDFMYFTKNLVVILFSVFDATVWQFDSILKLRLHDIYRRYFHALFNFNFVDLFFDARKFFHIVINIRTRRQELTPTRPKINDYRAKRIGMIIDRRCGE